MLEVNTNSIELHGMEKLPLRDNATPMHSTSNGQNDDQNGECKYYEELAASKEPEDNVSSDKSSHSLSVKEAGRWRIGALVICSISVICLFILGFISFYVSVKTNSAAAYGFGFDCILDICTSVVVIWRFYGSVGTLYSAERERIALSFLGTVFVLASISIVTRAILNLESERHTIPAFSLYVLAATSGSVCTLFAIIKFIIARKLESRSLRTDGISSVAGAILGFSILISTEVIKHNKSIWFLDEVIATIVGVCLGWYGTSVLMEVFSESSVHPKLVGLCCCCKKVESNVI